MKVHSQYQRENTDRLYVSRKKKEKENSSSIEDCVDATIQGPEEYPKRSKEKLITTDINNRYQQISTNDINRNNPRTNRKTTNEKFRSGEKTTVWILQEYQSGEIANDMTWI